MRDLMNNIQPSSALAPATVTDNTAQTTSILDTAGMVSVALLILTGTLADADATFAVTLAESDNSNMSSSNAVAAVDLIGENANGTALVNASFDFSADGKVRKLGYKGGKRYIQATITPAANTGNAPLAAIWAAVPHSRPAANPPA